MINFYMESYGCSTNMSEAEVMSGLLEEHEFKQTDKEEAFVLIINICTVKGDATAIKHVRDLKKQYPNKKYVITGCITKDIIKEVRNFEPEASFLSTHNIKEIVETVEETINDNPIEATAYNNETKINLPRIRKNKTVAIIPILSGCNGNCTYCSVKAIKGQLVSYDEQDILKEAKKAIKEGCKEIWITSQDNACYGLDKGKPRLSQLLTQITELPGEFKIRLGMMNPNNVLPILESLIKIYAHPKMYKFLHIPVQSGSDEILKAMNRHYTAEEFKHIIDKFRIFQPEITIATDMIVAYPEETSEQFQQTIDLVRETTPDIINISRYRPRPGTEASNIHPVSGDEARRRSNLLSNIFQNTAQLRNERWYDWQGEVTVIQKGKDNTVIAYNFAYKQVIIPQDLPLGTSVSIKITKITPFHLKAQIPPQLRLA